MRPIPLLVAGALVLSLVGCGGQQRNRPAEFPENQPPSPVVETEPAPAVEATEPGPALPEGLSYPNVNAVVVDGALLDRVVTRPELMVLAGEGSDTEWTPTSFEDAMAVLDDRPDWQHTFAPIYISPHPAERFLEGLVVVLDPGHGARSLEVEGYKTGPTGVREAEMNLRVSLLLKRMLEDAGAEVTLTRETEFNEIADDRLEDTLRLRAELANTLERPDGGVGADLFISVHHNASSNPDRNFTSIWYHGEADWNEPVLDLARGIAHHVARETRTQAALTSPLMSDFQMYDTGFGVLRHTEVPSILLELSFFSNPIEEQRLRDAEYNLRQAYAIYLAMCEWAYSGLPTQSPPDVQVIGDALRMVTTLDDGVPDDWWGNERLRTLPSTLAVFLDGERLAIEFDEETDVLTATAEALPSVGDQPLELVLSIHHQNFLKNSNAPQRYTVTLLRVGGSVVVDSVTPAGPRRAVR